MKVIWLENRIEKKKHKKLTESSFSSVTERRAFYAEKERETDWSGYRTMNA